MSHDEFEAHWLKIRGAKKAANELQRHPLQPQVYVADNANRHWVTWQRAQAAALRNAWHQINGMIPHGDIGGNGFDATAQRNGVILAANKLHMIYGTMKDGEA